MASMQKSREERAEAAAHKAADELHTARREGLQEPGGGGGGGGGMMETVQESARSLLGAVRDKISGPGSGGGATAEEGKGMADATAEKAAEAKDFAAGKAEGAVERAADVKERARRTLAGSAPGRKGETNESAWQQGEDVRRRAAEKAEEARRSSQHEPSVEEKGRAATENIYGSAADATEAFKQKMTMPEDVVEQKQRAVAAGGKGAGATTATATTTGRSSGGEGEAEDVMLRVKAADQMTGQAFNDVGKMGEEGTGMDGTGARRGH